MDAFGAPIAAQAMRPPLTTSSGLTPKNAGFQSTRSASLPASTDPSCWARPCAMAGLIVYFAMYRFTRVLSSPEVSPGSGPRWRFILSAVCQVRMITSPMRPIACGAEDIMLIAPRSCSTSSAAIVSAPMRDSANARSARIRARGWWAPLRLPSGPATGGAGRDLLAQRIGRGGVALAEEAEVERKRLRRLEHAVDVPGARGARRRVGPRRGAGAAADQGREPGADRLVDELGADEVDVRVEPAGGDDLPLTRDHLRRRADHHALGDAVHQVGIARLADRDDPPVPDPNVG